MILEQYPFRNFVGIGVDKFLQVVVMSLLGTELEFDLVHLLYQV